MISKVPAFLVSPENQYEHQCSLNLSQFIILCRYGSHGSQTYDNSNSSYTASGHGGAYMYAPYSHYSGYYNWGNYYHYGQHYQNAHPPAPLDYSVGFCYKYNI